LNISDHCVFVLRYCTVSTTVNRVIIRHISIGLDIIWSASDPERVQTFSW